MVFISVGNRIDNIYPFKAKLKTTVFGEQWRPCSVVGQKRDIESSHLFNITLKEYEVYGMSVINNIKNWYGTQLTQYG